MVEVGIRALKQNASAVVAQAAGGATVTVTDRGRPVVQLTRIPASPLQRMLDSGRARAPRRAIRDLPPPEASADVTSELATLRDAERY